MGWEGLAHSPALVLPSAPLARPQSFATYLLIAWLTSNIIFAKFVSIICALEWEVSCPPVCCPPLLLCAAGRSRLRARPRYCQAAQAFATGGRPHTTRTPSICSLVVRPPNTLPLHPRRCATRLPTLCMAPSSRTRSTTTWTWRRRWGASSTPPRLSWRRRPTRCALGGAVAGGAFSSCHGATVGHLLFQHVRREQTTMMADSGQSGAACMLQRCGGPRRLPRPPTPVPAAHRCSIPLAACPTSRRPTPSCSAAARSPTPLWARA